jgi:hypothetical protein
MAPYAIYRDAEQLGAELVKFRQDFVVQCHLIAADRAPIGGIKREDYRLALEFRERDRLVRCCTEAELGCVGARGERSVVVGHESSLVWYLLPL